MADGKKVLNDEELGNVNGGACQRGWRMTVTAKIPLREQPYEAPYNVKCDLHPGHMVFTYGEITRGTGAGGAACQYMKVNYDDIWGWADASYLH